MKSCGHEVNLIDLIIMADERLSMLRDLWTEAQGDKRLEVKERRFR